MCFYDSYPVFWEHSDLENPLQHQTSTTLLWLLRENPSTLPLSCSRCCVSTSTPKPRAEGSSPSAPATKPAKTLGFRRFAFCTCCMGVGCILVRTPGFLIWFDPFSTVLIPSSTQNAPDFGCFRMKSGASLFFAGFRAQNFRHLFCPLCRYGSQVEVVGDSTQSGCILFNIVQLCDLRGGVAQQVCHLAGC